MKHTPCARGIAAASLALASTTASATPPAAAYANGYPTIASPGRLSAGLGDDGTVINSTNIAPAPDRRSPMTRRAEKMTKSEVTSTNPVDRPLHALIRGHVAPGAMDGERECLATAIYFEARGEPLGGQLAVAEVVINRAASGEYPASICDVVKQPAQFSFVRDGLFPPIDESSSAWRTAVAVAHVAAEKLANKLASDVLWYHADYVAPAWGRRLDRVTQIGAHIFYRRA